jgi:hypothetical protein
MPRDKLRANMSGQLLRRSAREYAGRLGLVVGCD